VTRVIVDSFDPRRGPDQVDLQEVPDPLLRQLAMSGSREAARELARRRRQ